MELASQAYARMMAGLLPPGPLFDALGMLLADFLLGTADELARLDARAHALIEESHPGSATELLPEFEAELGLVAASTIEERRAQIVARTIARQRYRPVDFQTALAPLLGQDAGDVIVIERSHADAVSFGDDREVFRFFVYRDPSAPGDYFLEAAQDLVDTIKPSHTAGHVIESVSFLCDDPFSLCDRDLLGA